MIDETRDLTVLLINDITIYLMLAVIGFLTRICIMFHGSAS